MRMAIFLEMALLEFVFIDIKGPTPHNEASKQIPTGYYRQVIQASPNATSLVCRTMHLRLVGHKTNITHDK